MERGSRPLNGAQTGRAAEMSAVELLSGGADTGLALPAGDDMVRTWPAMCSLALLTLWDISVSRSSIIQLPPGDYVTTYLAQLSASGTAMSQQEADSLRAQYGLDQPVYVQYLRWVGLVVRGEFGMSMDWQRPVADVIGDRLALTVALSLAAVAFTWALALPIGIYSAGASTRSPTTWLTVIGFLAWPSQLPARPGGDVLHFVLFNANIVGLFSPETSRRRGASRGCGDLLKAPPLPALILALAGTAQMIRIMRANLLDELGKPYVVTARAKGLSERR